MSSDPPSGAIVNWNNKPAAAFSAADDNFSYGTVHRVQLLDSRVAAKKVHTPASVVGAMNAAATQDLRATLVPVLAEAMGSGTAPSARDAQLLQTLQAWNGSRLDANLDGKIDAVGAAIMDGWWPKLALAVLQPQLGPLTTDLTALAGISNDAKLAGKLLRRRLVLVRQRGGGARRSARPRVRSPVEPARRLRARPFSGSRSIRRAMLSPRFRAPTPWPGAPMPQPSGSISQAFSATRCAGRTARRSSR